MLQWNVPLRLALHLRCQLVICRMVIDKVVYVIGMATFGGFHRELSMSHIPLNYLLQVRLKSP